MVMPASWAQLSARTRCSPRTARVKTSSAMAPGLMGLRGASYPPPVDIVLDRPAHVQSAPLWVQVAPLQPGQLTSPQAGRGGDGDSRGQDRLAVALLPRKSAGVWLEVSVAPEEAVDAAAGWPDR